MYCIKCGVKLGEAEQCCPLCNTIVCHPDFKPEVQQGLYPPKKLPEVHSGRAVVNGAILILFLVPLAVCFFSDLHINRTLDWFGYVAGALCLTYICLVLSHWFRKPNPVIFVPCAFVAAGLYLLYVNHATGGNWYGSFALPVLGGLCFLTCAVVTLARYVKRGRLYIFGGAFMALGLFTYVIERLLCKTFSVKFIGWCFYPLGTLLILGGLLIYLAINRSACEVIRRKLFF